MIGKTKELLEWLWEQDKDKIFEIKEYKKKRSLNSNSYLWLLCTEIAGIMNMTKEEVYIQMLEDYGVSLLVPLRPEKYPDGYFKYYKFYENGRINGMDCKWYKVFKGSSQYNSKEMSILLNGVVLEAKNLGIMTLDEIELKEMLDKWT